METPVIRYNLKDRGRQHTGQRRNFNVKAICDAINGGPCQEAVALRTMIGYYGHMPRVRYGMAPVEGGIEGGKYAPVEPAFVTTYLRADYQGNVEHKAEFLDTATGKLAAKLWESKVGGFSSAIDQVKPEFYGFDFVIAPNFALNSFRGVALDDAMSGNIGALTYDDVYAAEQDERAQSMLALLDSVNRERVATSEVIERLSAENEHLLSMLAKGTEAVLDSSGIAPLAIDCAEKDRMDRDISMFRYADLPRYVEPKPEADVPDALYGRLMGKFSR